MAHCKKCGADTAGYRGRPICYACMKKWKENRMKAFEQATAEIGPMCGENLKAIQKRIKEIENGV